MIKLLSKRFCILWMFDLILLFLQLRNPMTSPLILLLNWWALWKITKRDWIEGKTPLKRWHSKLKREPLKRNMMIILVDEAMAEVDTMIEVAVVALLVVEDVVDQQSNDTSPTRATFNATIEKNLATKRQIVGQNRKPRNQRQTWSSKLKCLRHYLWHIFLATPLTRMSGLLIDGAPTTCPILVLNFQIYPNRPRRKQKKYIFFPNFIYFCEYVVSDIVIFSLILLWSEIKLIFFPSL